jgi:hypothetical protein
VLVVLRRPLVVTRNLPPVVLVAVGWRVWRDGAEWAEWVGRVVELGGLASVVGTPAVVETVAVVVGLTVVIGLTVVVGLRVLVRPRPGVVVMNTVDEVVVGARRPIEVRLLLGRPLVWWTMGGAVTFD